MESISTKTCTLPKSPVLREVSFFTRRGAPGNWGIRYFFFDQKGIKRFFQIKKGDHLYLLKK